MMREGRKSWLYAAWTIAILSAFYEVRSAPPAVNITEIKATDSKSLKVTWDDVSRASSDTITSYTVCYQLTSGVDCSSGNNKTVNGSTFSTELTELNEGTKYYAAVFASTASSNGPLGMECTTGESTPGEPLINIENVELTKISLRWSKPKAPNGEIIQYKLCWKADGLGTCNIETNPPKILPYNLHHLKPGTNYTISISAFTKIGEGHVASEKVKTDASDFEEVQLTGTSVVDIGDDTTQIGFELPEIKLSEAGKISKIHVIVKRWTKNDNKETLRATRQSNLTNFTNSANGKKAYIALSINDSINNIRNIIVGDDTRTTSRRKRRNVQSYRNAPLNEDTQYAIFVRVFYEDITSFSTSDILVATTAKKGDAKSYHFVILIMTLPGLAVLFATAIFLLIRRCRASKTSNTDVTQGIKRKRNERTSEVIYDQPFQHNRDDGNYEDVRNYDDVGNYDDVRNVDATYTALNHRTDWKQDGHVYARLLEWNTNPAENESQI